ncbi:MAG: ABC transporter permease [Gammaproteobacteria bacterium]|nr:ABC transporter permease [Gammaproteobacteria bacterium]
MMALLSGAWRYRYFVISSISNEFKVRFVRSRLGAMWMVLHPLAQVAIFAFILSAVLSAKLPGIDNKYAYSIYLMAGMLFWSLFSEVVSRCTTLFVDNGNLLKKMQFPKVTLLLVVAGTSLVSNLLLFLAMMAIFQLLGHASGVMLFWLPVTVFVTLLLAFGVGLLLGVVNVFVRDVAQVVPVMLQLFFWFTPIVYMVEIIPRQYASWFALNPMYHLVSAYQNILLFNRTPDVGALGVIALISLFVLALATFMFHKAKEEMVDML